MAVFIVLDDTEYSMLISVLEGYKDGLEKAKGSSCELALGMEHLVVESIEKKLKDAG